MPKKERSKVPDKYVPWINLAGEVIKVTVADYKKALDKGDEQKVKEFERWFRSKYFRILTMDSLDPEYIIKNARKYGAAKRKWTWDGTIW